MADDDESKVICTFSEDGDRIAVTFEGDPPFTVELSAKQFDALIEDGGYVRAALDPQQPDKPSLNAIQSYPPHPRPGYLFGQDLALGDFALYLRDVRFGWLAYHFEREEIEEFMQTINRVIREIDKQRGIALAEARTASFH